MNAPIEVKLSIENFKSQKRNYQKCVPGARRLRELADNDTFIPEGDFRRCYDIDGIIGAIDLKDIRLVLKEKIKILYSDSKPKIKNFYVTLDDKSILTTKCFYNNIGYIQLPGEYKLKLFLLSHNIPINRRQVNNALTEFSKMLQATFFNNLKYYTMQRKYEGTIEVVDFMFLESSLQKIFDDAVFLYFELVGCKKLFNSQNIEVLKNEVNKYVNISHPNILVDFCMSYSDSSQCILYPKLSTLNLLGERPNYFQYYSNKCLCVNRYKSKYISSNKFFNDCKISKINFYSTTQDFFHDYTVKTFYPHISSGLLKDIFSDNYKYTNFNKELKKIHKIKNAFYNSYKNTNELYAYRFEFRMSANDIDSVRSKLKRYLIKEFFTFIPRKEFFEKVINKIEHFTDLFNKQEKAIINVGKFVLLELLFVSGFLRGDRFKMPFTTINIRKLIKNLYTLNLCEFQDTNIKEVLEDPDHLAILENYYNSSYFLNLEEKELMEYIINLKYILNNKELLFKEIQSMIFYNQKNNEGTTNPFCLNSLDYFTNTFYSNLEIYDPRRQLIDTYIQLHGFEIFNDLFENIEKFYCEITKLNYYFDNKIDFESIRIKKEKEMILFIEKLPKTKDYWTEYETNELYFLKMIYEKLKDKISIFDLYKNFTFSFHLRRTFNSFKIKFYKLKEIKHSKLEIASINSRFKYIKNIIKFNLTMQFKKDYIYLVYQDILRLRLNK